MSTLPSNNNVPAQSKRQTEIRCGLVLYGGVSLAVYINGVVREFFEAVRGRGTYAVLKDFLDADIVVDIVSGASAGGVNGVFLGRALATGGDFAASAELWRNKGDFAELLEDPMKSTFENGKRYPPSLFKSHEFYEVALEDALRTLGEPIAPGPDDSPSFVSEMDVFIAATDFYGRVWTERDARDSLIEIKDHRSVFHLKHRIDRIGEQLVVRKSAFVQTNDDQDEDVQKGLARIARITSSFPAAFQPVPFDPNDKTDKRNTFLNRALSHKQGLEKTWFVDGGVLDNKPFSSTLREIYNRSTDRAVDRKVFYVEPDPDRLVSAPGGAHRTEPEAEAVVFASILTLPSYESVAGDLETVKLHNDRVRRFKELSDSLRDVAVPGGHDEAAMKVYVRARRAALRDEIVDAIRADRSIDDLPKLNGWLQAVIGTVLAPDQSRTVGTSFDHLDARLHLRRHFHLVYLAYDALHGRGGIAKDLGINDGETANVLRYLYAQIERIQAAHNALNEVTVGWSDQLLMAASKFKVDSNRGSIEDPVFTAFVTATQRTLELDPQLDAQMDLTGDMNADGRNRLYAQLWERAQIHSNPESFAKSSESLEVRLTILSRVQSETEGWIASQVEKTGKAATFWTMLQSAWNNYPSLDVYLFPLQVASGVHEQDVIELVRVSPGDARTDVGPQIATYSRMVPPTKKLCGDTFFHFGGFFKRSWRSNDILWGRLDSADILISSIVTKDSLARALVDKDLIEVRDTFKAKLRLDEADAISLLQDMREAVSGQSDMAVKRIQARFIRAAQRGICMEGLPGLLEDRIVDRLEWAERDPESRAAAREAAHLRNALENAHKSGDWAAFDKLAKAELLAGPGDEGMGDVARPKLLRVGLGAGLLIERALRERLAKTKFRWVTTWISRLLGFPLRIGYTALTFYERGHTIRAAAMVASTSVFLVTAGLACYAFWTGAKRVGVVASAVALGALSFSGILGFLARGTKKRNPNNA